MGGRGGETKELGREAGWRRAALPTQLRCQARRVSPRYLRASVILTPYYTAALCLHDFSFELSPKQSPPKDGRWGQETILNVLGTFTNNCGDPVDQV